MGHSLFAIDLVEISSPSFAGRPPERALNARMRTRRFVAFRGSRMDLSRRS